MLASARLSCFGYTTLLYISAGHMLCPLYTTGIVYVLCLLSDYESCTSILLLVFCYTAGF